MQIGPPIGEESLQVVPVLLRECSMHCGRNRDNLVCLVDLGAHQLRL